MNRHLLTACAFLSISSLVHAGPDFEGRTHDFGATPRGPMLTHYFQFTNNSKETLTIGSLRVSCGCVLATAPVAHIKPGESSYITAQMDTRRFVGHKAVTVYVGFIAPRHEEVTLQVKANGRDDITIYPEALAFGSQRKGTTATTTAQVTFRSDPGLKIESVKCDSSHVKGDAKLLKSNGFEVTYEIKATMDANLAPGRWRSDVWLQTNSREFGTVRIPLSVEVTAPVTASPESLQLGEVKVGDSVEQNVMLRGDKPFKIKSVRGAEPMLTISGIDSESKKVHVLKIAYKATTSGEIKQTLAILTEDGDEPIITIPFQAKAVKE